MERHPHDRAGGRRVRVQVITVSTSRTTANDVSGPLLRELVLAAGHEVAGHTLVEDDPDAIGAKLDELLGDVGVEALVFTGGTGISARDCTPAVVRTRLDRELPGFGEIFRMLSWSEVGAAAMLSTALGGVARGRPVFALPGSPKACRLAMEKLILPELGHLVSELAKETPLPTKGAKPAAPRTTTAAAPAASGDVVPEPEPDPDYSELLVPKDAAAERPPEEELGAGWRAGLRALDGEIRPGGYGEIPEDLERYAAACDVLNAAGARGKVVLADGREYAAFGYPDLLRNSSKVLLVRAGAPIAEIVALHRWPRWVGLCAEGEDGLVPSADLDPSPVAEDRTGTPFDGPGQLFAVESTSIYLVDGRRVARFDGRELAGSEPMSSALGSLMLHWSQR